MVTRCLSVMFMWLLVAPLAAQNSPPQLVTASPTLIDFGPIKIGSEVAVPVTIRNDSAVPVSLAGGGMADGTRGFVCFNQTCPAGTLAPGASCTQSCRFRPALDDGSLVSDFRVIEFSNGGQVQPIRFDVTGSGIGTLVHIAPVSFDFGEWLLGATSSVDVTITNNSTDTVTTAGGGFTGFGFSAGQGSCSGTLVAGASCALTYSFTPSQLGPVSGQTGIGVTMAAGGISRTYPISFSGTGISAPRLANTRPVSFNFGNVILGDRALVAVRFSNPGGSALDTAGGGFSGSGAFSAFALTGTGCSSSVINAGQTCTSAHYFSPLSVGVQSDSTNRQFTRNAEFLLQPINVSGTGVGKIARVWPQVIGFGPVRVVTVVSVPVTITNTTWRPLTSFQGGGVSDPFFVVNNCPSSLAVGASCQYTYSFAPGATTAVFSTTTAISFANDAGAQAVYQIQLSGSGNDTQFRNGFE